MKGAIAAGHKVAAESGARVLSEGGNALDACIAAAVTAFVAEGPLTGPAGGGFLLAQIDGRTTFLDCFFATPSRPPGPMEEIVVDFADAATQVFHVGEASVAVPGLVAGLLEAHRCFGRAPWPELVEPAIEVARTGVEPGEAHAFLHTILAAILQREEGGRRLYGNPAHVDTTDLVPTLELLRDDPRAVVPSLIPELAADVKAYEVVEREPLEGTFTGYRVATAPAPSRGGAIVATALAGFEHADDLHGEALALGAAYAGSSQAVPRVTGTTHVSVVDAAGDAVALSSTLGSGSGVFRGGAQLNNMLGELDVIGTDPRPAGARLPSMMAPTMLLADGAPRLVLGSAGSVRLSGAIAQVAAAVGRGTPVAEAIDAPRIHVEGQTLHVEGGWPEESTAGLSDHWQVVRWAGRNLFFGGVSAVELRPDGTLAAAGDPRRDGHGIVVG